MSANVSDTLVVVLQFIGMYAMYTLGRIHGIGAERRRVKYLIDVASCTVTSWSVVVLDEAVHQRISVEELREGLRKKWTWEKLK